ncbi:MAG: hypothetical protein PHN31_01110 [Candidatus Gracilibacteria bacterium]|nr:hypothetical protein [Candidatus Gracilibacteria bacterium]
MKKKFIIILFLILGFLGKTFADIYIPDENYVPATYTYNKDDLNKVLENKIQFLYKVSCAKSEVLKSLGLDKYDITALSFMDGDYEYNFDLKNCSLYVNNPNSNSSNIDNLTKKEALKISDDFIKNNLKDKKYIYLKLGKPIITYVHYANPGITVEQLKQEPNDLSVSEKYMSISITYPFLVGGKYIYGSSGIIYGINFEVSKKGITSFTSTLFKYKLEKISGELMSNEDYTFIISKGGNNPYYGTPTNIDFKKIESVYLMSPIYTSVGNSNYLSSGIGLFSDKNSLNRFYEIISDYKQGNAYGFLY